MEGDGASGAGDGSRELPEEQWVGAEGLFGVVELGLKRLGQFSQFIRTPVHGFISINRETHRPRRQRDAHRRPRPHDCYASSSSSSSSTAAAVSHRALLGRLIAVGGIIGC